jgi:hypothetical protein
MAEGDVVTEWLSLTFYDSVRMRFSLKEWNNGCRQRWVSWEYLRRDEVVEEEVASQKPLPDDVIRCGSVWLGEGGVFGKPSTVGLLVQ